MSSTIQSANPATTSGSAPGLSRHQESFPGNGEQQEDFSVLVSDVSEALGRYCARRPRVIAGCVFSLGFILGWKLRPW